MAIVRRFHCIICGQDKEEVRSSSDYSSECMSCKETIKNKEEREWKAGRDGLTIEERIKDIENFIYHHTRHEHYKEPMLFG